MRIQFNFNKTIIILLGTLNVLFVLYYIMLSTCTQLHYDDMNMLVGLKDGFWQHIQFLYNTNAGRISQFVIVGSLVKLIGVLGNYYWILPILMGGAAFYFTWLALSNLFTKEMRLLAFLSIMLAFNLSILTNIEFSLFYWIVGTIYYWLMPLFLLLMKLVMKKNITKVNYISMIVLAVIIGLIHETFTPFVLIVLFVYGMYLFKKCNYKFSVGIKDSNIQRVLLVALIMIISLFVVILAPGTFARVDNTHGGFQVDSFLSLIQGFANGFVMYSYFQLFYVPYYFILACVFCCLGMKSNYKFNMIHIYMAILCLFTHISFIVLCNVLLTGGFGIQRVYTPVVFSTIMAVCFIGFAIGAQLEKYRYILKPSCTIGVIILICVMIGNLYIDIPSAQRFAASVDERIEYALEQKAQGFEDKVLEVPPIEIPYTFDTKYVLLRMLNIETNRPVLHPSFHDTGTHLNRYAIAYDNYYKLGFKILPKSDILEN